MIKYKALQHNTNIRVDRKIFKNRRKIDAGERKTGVFQGKIPYPAEPFHIYALFNTLWNPEEGPKMLYLSLLEVVYI